MKEHYPTLGPDNIERYTIVYEQTAMRNDGTMFKDYDVHKILKKNKIKNVGGEWFQCTEAQLKAAIIAVKNMKKI